MNVLIVEDEPLTARRMKGLLSETDPSMNAATVTGSIESTVDWLSKNQAPDLIFMDIQLSDGICFEIFELIKVDSPVIFTTAFDEYAIQAFKVNSIDYLLKPVKKEDLTRALEKLSSLKKQLAGNHGHQDIRKLIAAIRESHSVYRSGFLLKSGQSFYRISTSEIAYITTENKLTYIVLHNGKKHFTDFTLDSLENELDPQQFFRANRQYILNIKSIEDIHPYYSGSLKLHLVPGTNDEVIVPRRKASLFKEWMDK